MHDDTGESVDLWREVASAVEYIAAMERPGFIVWDAVTEAIEAWLDDDTLPALVAGSHMQQDSLRHACSELLDRWHASDAPGAGFADVLSSALSTWLERQLLDGWSHVHHPPRFSAFTQP